MKPTLKCHGFTLTEIIVVLALLTVLTAIAIPNFLSWLPNYRLNAAVRSLQIHFQMAKLEAVKRRTKVCVEFNIGGYVPAGMTGGYTVFSDTNSNRVFDAGDTLIKQVTMPVNVSLISSNFAGNGNGTNTAVSFRPLGIKCQLLCPVRDNYLVRFLIASIY